MISIVGSSPSKANKKGKQSKNIAPIAASDVPTLVSWSKKGFIIFFNSVKNLKAKCFNTDVRLQISNDECKMNLFYELQLYELMIDEKEFISILDDLSSFNEMENIL